MTWLWLLAVPLALAIDALADQDKRASLIAMATSLVAANDNRNSGHRPRPSSTPRSPPQGTRGVPAKPPRGHSAAALIALVNSAKRVPVQTEPRKDASMDAYLACVAMYRPTRKVNSATVRPPNSQTAVTTARPVLGGGFAWPHRDLKQAAKPQPGRRRS